MEYYRGQSSYDPPPPYTQPYPAQPHSAHPDAAHRYPTHPCPPHPNPPHPHSARTSHTPAFPPGVQTSGTGYLQDPSQRYAETTNHAGPSRSRGTDYLLSIQKGMNGLSFGGSPRASTSAQSTPSPGRDKPLPRLPPPPPPIPPRPHSLNATGSYGEQPAPSHWAQNQLPLPTPPRTSIHDYPYNASPVSPLSGSSWRQSLFAPPKAFRASHTLLLPKLQPPQPDTRLFRPHSDPLIPTVPPIASPRKAYKNPKKKISDVIYIDSGSDSSDTHTPAFVTSRSPARRHRITSEQPPDRPAVALPKPKSSTHAQPLTPRKAKDSVAVQCSGFTQTGAPCKRLVKAKAPFVALSEKQGAYVNEADQVDSGTTDDKEERRYCKDHAGMICGEPGFCWQGNTPARGIYIVFDEFIPASLSQQTQTILRLTMESPLTAKDSPGFLYAYELRDLRTPSTSFFKVGRTDNVPRRIAEWTKECRTHTPTLRDLFPIPPTLAQPHNPDSSYSLHRTPTLPSSFLPGARRQSDNPARRCPAMKRWERLVHIELADLAAQHAPEEYAGLKEKCGDCGRVHQEIFALGHGTGDSVYEERVKDVVLRWERFVRRICEG